MTSIAPGTDSPFKSARRSFEHPGAVCVGIYDRRMSIGYRDHTIKAQDLNSNFIGAPFTYQRNSIEICGRIERILHANGGTVVWLGGSSTQEHYTDVLELSRDEEFHIPPAGEVWGTPSN